jgi:hypothetical protein
MTPNTSLPTLQTKIEGVAITAVSLLILTDGNALCWSNEAKGRSAIPRPH